MDYELSLRNKSSPITVSAPSPSEEPVRKRRKCSLPIADNYADVTISFDLLLEQTERPQDWAGIRLRGRKTGREGYFVIVRRDGRVEIVWVGPGSQEQILDSYTFPHTSQKMHFTIVAISTRISVALGGTEIMRIEADQYTDIGGVFLEACRATALFSNLEILPSPSAPPATLHGPLRQLTALIRARREAGDRPYTLLLGSSLSLTPEVRRTVCDSHDWEIFWTAIQALSAAERRALLASPLGGLNLTAGYRCLAQLVQAGFFDLVFTLNVDDALDESLRILPAREYQIFTHGQVLGAEIAAALGRTHPRVKVVKLRGDINAYKLPLTPEGQFEFPKELEEAVERLLSQDTIVVGDISHDTDIQRCIREGEGALWIVAPEVPRPGSFLYNAIQSRPGKVISGPEADFVPFFSALAHELGMEGPTTSMPSPKRRKLIEFTFTPPEPANYWDWLSVFRMITEEHRASGSWTDNNDVENRINRLEDFLKPFCRGQVYGASFALYSKDADGNFYEEVRVKVKPGRMLIFEVTDRTQAQKRDKLANIIRREIGKLKGVRFISPTNTQTVAALNPFGDTGRITDPDRFFGREELLRQIFEELGKGVNLSLVGESQIGKSSLLSMVCALGPKRMGLPPETFAYLSLEWVDSEKEFYEALCDALSVETCRGYKLTRALRDKRYVLCLDEIEKMTWEGFTVRVRSQLRGLADGPAAPLKLVIASRSPLANLFPDSTELTSPLAGICRQLNVRPFPPDIARTFLAYRLRGTDVTFTKSEINTLLAETGGHPAKLQRAAADLYNAKREART